ncbi:aldehyde dehydrogenase family protein [Variovorax sp. J2P1-59]|uniref:aldehyde dehydrogenase family protein n=1 Tax=Variovorax flavidus TaxID=3053501 RepID=UPI0025785488|nr:aldehyde dehydrogenase family protein [Variovorax sp. J2P1-59]MDM0078089.1 aldehyde dehydrogenase family protein [Variovorax sp. J2P1-59]
MLQSIDARTGAPFGEPWAGSDADGIDAAVAAAQSAADVFAAAPAALRARLLRQIATALEAQRASLVPLADRETGLGSVRLEGELDRAAFQLREFAVLLETGGANFVLDQPPVAGPPPTGRPRMTRVRVPLGPVAVFAASNFPFAFSVAGGDTASALAAGCPVVAKGHPAHPGLCVQVAALVADAVARCGLPAGVFQFVQGAAVEVGERLVQAPSIDAVAFTGSFRGGTALARLAAARPRPIPFYGELGSVNPVVVMPRALANDAPAKAALLGGSICQGAGQFCTSPGVIVVFRDEAGDAFVTALAEDLRQRETHGMLSEGIRANFERGVAAWRQHDRLEVRVDAESASVSGALRPFLAEIAASDFVADRALHEEVFGAAALVVRVDTAEEAIAVLRAIGGSLTVTLWGLPADLATPDAAEVAVVRAAMKIAGRVLFAGVPTGVAVCAAQHHGGPFPASTAPFTTSVGQASMERFLRPQVLQDAPEWLLERDRVLV